MGSKGKWAIDDLNGPYGVQCPTCGMGPHNKCRQKGIIVAPHTRRLLAAGKLLPVPVMPFQGCPNCGKGGKGKLVRIFGTYASHPLLGKTVGGALIFGPESHVQTNLMDVVRCRNCHTEWGWMDLVKLGLATILDPNDPTTIQRAVLEDEDQAAQFVVYDPTEEDL